MPSPILRINLLAALLNDVIPSPDPQTRNEALSALLKSPAALARMEAYRASIASAVNRAFTSDGGVSAAEHAGLAYSLLVACTTEMASHFYEAGKRAGQAEWLDELCEMEVRS